MLNKVFLSFDEAVADINDGACIGIESWGHPATAQNLIAAIKRKGVKDITIVTHNFIPLLAFSEEEVVTPTALLPQMKRLITAVVGLQARKIKGGLDRETIAMRAAKELRDGDCVNLGLGIPQLCSLYIPEGVIFQSQNGALGYGSLVLEDEIEQADWHYIAAGRFFTPMPGMALFDLLTSFAMIRSSRLITILGGLQVSEKGDLANWNVADDPLGGTIGGGMDLALGAKRVIITMEHTNKDGKPKIVKTCTYPLTAKECVDLIITDLAVIEVKPEGLVLREVAPGWRAEEVQALTEPNLIIAPDIREIEL